MTGDPGARIVILLLLVIASKVDLIEAPILGLQVTHRGGVEGNGEQRSRGEVGAKGAQSGAQVFEIAYRGAMITNRLEPMRGHRPSIEIDVNSD
jgi:hypothetical protein